MNPKHETWDIGRKIQSLDRASKAFLKSSDLVSGISNL